MFFPPHMFNKILPTFRDLRSFLLPPPIKLPVRVFSFHILFFVRKFYATHGIIRLQFKIFSLIQIFALFLAQKRIDDADLPDSFTYLHDGTK